MARDQAGMPVQFDKSKSKIRRPQTENRADRVERTLVGIQKGVVGPGVDVAKEVLDWLLPAGSAWIALLLCGVGAVPQVPRNPVTPVIWTCVDHKYKP